MVTHLGDPLLQRHPRDEVVDTLFDRQTGVEVARRGGGGLPLSRRLGRRRENGHGPEDEARESARQMSTEDGQDAWHVTSRAMALRA